MPGLVRMAAALIVTVSLAGCGIPTQSGAQALPSGAAPTFAPTESPSPSVSPTPTPSPTPTQTTTPEPPAPSARLWFVKEEGIAPIIVDVPGTEPEQLIEALAAGPPEGNPELRSVVVDPLTGAPLVTAVTAQSPNPAIATVAVVPDFTALPPSEQVLLIGQVVFTLTTQGPASAVLFVDAQGEALAVPLPNGRLLDGPATAADYRALVVL